LRHPLSPHFHHRLTGHGKIGKINRKTVFGRASANGLVNIAEQAGGTTRRIYPMTLTIVMVFEILAALVLGFVIGRIWQIRRDEIERRSSFTLPTVARIPHPTGAETNHQASVSTAHCRLTIENRPDRNAITVRSHRVAI
jgi:hypothetical protein